MTPEELNEARTNPEFLNYLEQTRKDAIQSKNIEALYEVLDSLLILDLEEEKINNVYENILKIAFENVEKLVNSGKKLRLENEELYYVRSFYEHAIEKWSYSDLKGAKEILFVLANVIDDDALEESLKVLLIVLAKELDLDSFYEEKVDLNSVSTQEKYGYFIMNFKFDAKEYIKENQTILFNEYEALKHLLD